MTDPVEPTETERAITAWALARLAFHVAAPLSLERLEAEQESALAERILVGRELAGDETAATFLRGLTDAEEAIARTAPEYRR